MSGSVYSRYFALPIAAAGYRLLVFLDKQGNHASNPPVCLVHHNDLGFTAPYLRQHLRLLWERELINSASKDLLNGAYQIKLTQLGRTFLAGVEQPLFPNF